MNEKVKGSDPRRKLVWFVGAACLLFAGIDSTIVATAITAMQVDFEATIVWTGWVVTIYAFTLILVMPVAGRLSDQFGAKAVLLVAIVLFGGGSLGCAVAADLGILVVWRAVQALRVRVG